MVPLLAGQSRNRVPLGEEILEYVSVGPSVIVGVGPDETDVCKLLASWGVGMVCRIVTLFTAPVGDRVPSSTFLFLFPISPPKTPPSVATALDFDRPQYWRVSDENFGVLRFDCDGLVGMKVT